MEAAMTTATDVEIIDAGPEHARFVAWVTLAAWRSHLPLGMWDHMFGGADGELLDYLEVLTATERMHWVHYSLFSIARVGGTPAAALSGFFDELQVGNGLQLGMQEASEKTGRTADPERIARALTILNISMNHEPGAWVVESVATRPEFRRRGLIDILMEHMLERGRERGATVADIGVFIGNDPAQKAYEKHGFEVVDEKRDAEFEAVYGCPGARMLRRRL
jgi:ribosomal protein S18 acetylase RimI-like enzyme